MNNVPKDILGVTKLLRMIINHTTHWSHQNQARYVLKQWKTQEMLQMFHSHVSHVSWSCCIVLTNLVSLSEWHMLHLSVAHFTFHKRTTHLKYTKRCSVSKLCFMCYKFTKGCMTLSLCNKQSASNLYQPPRVTDTLVQVPESSLSSNLPKWTPESPRRVQRLS